MRNARFLRAALLVAALFLFAGTFSALYSQSTGPTAAATASPEQQAQPGAALSSQCADCHADLVKDFGSTRHGKAEKFQAWGYTESCGGCHGDTREHVASADPSKVYNPAGVTAITDQRRPLLR
jgi:mono/diheme cytochrome c family protein